MRSGPGDAARSPPDGCAPAAGPSAGRAAAGGESAGGAVVCPPFRSGRVSAGCRAGATSLRTGPVPGSVAVRAARTVSGASTSAGAGKGAGAVAGGGGTAVARASEPEPRTATAPAAAVSGAGDSTGFGGRANSRATARGFCASPPSSGAAPPVSLPPALSGPIACAESRPVSRSGAVASGAGTATRVPGVTSGNRPAQ